MKKWYQSKTNMFNLLVVVIAVLDLLSKQSFVPSEYVQYLLFGTAVLNIVLRTYFTKEPIKHRWNDGESM